VLDLFFRKAKQRPQSGLVPIDVNAGVIDDHGNDVFLDEGEDVAVGVAADLVQHALLVLAQARDGAHPSDALREEGLGEVEVTATEAVLNSPGVAYLAFETGLVRVLVNQHSFAPLLV
jgi:hypothetical protein